MNKVLPSKTGGPSVEAGKPWFVYLLRCSNGCLYAGITTDVQQRLKTHNAGKGSRYVRAHRPAKLVAFTASGNKSIASSLEYAVKSLTRPQKVALARKWRAAAGTDPEIGDLPSESAQP